MVEEQPFQIAHWKVYNFFYFFSLNLLLLSYEDMRYRSGIGSYWQG